MSHRTTTGRRVGALSGITALAFAGFALATAPSADAAEVTLDYNCTANVFGTQVDQGVWNVTIEADIPESVEPGAEIPAPNITATVVTSPEAADTLRGLDQETVEGTSAATYSVDDTERTANLTIPVTQVPDSGPITTVASGTGQAETAPETPGTVTVTVGDFTADLTAKNANGDPFEIPLTCTVAEGQDTTLATITVGDTGPEPSPSPTDSPTASPTDPSPTPTDPEPTDSPTASPTDPEPTDSPTATPTEPEPTDSPEPTDTATPTGTQEPSDPGQPTGPPVETGVVGEGDNATAAGVALLTISGAALAVATGRRRLRD